MAVVRQSDLITRADVSKMEYCYSFLSPLRGPHDRPGLLLRGAVALSDWSDEGGYQIMRHPLASMRA